MPRCIEADCFVEFAGERHRRWQSVERVAVAVMYRLSLSMPSKA